MLDSLKELFLQILIIVIFRNIKLSKPFLYLPLPSYNFMMLHFSILLQIQSILFVQAKKTINLINVQKFPVSPLKIMDLWVLVKKLDILIQPKLNKNVLLEQFSSSRLLSTVWYSKMIKLLPEVNPLKYFLKIRFWITLKMRL